MQYIYEILINFQNNYFKKSQCFHIHKSYTTAKCFLRSVKQVLAVIFCLHQQNINNISNTDYLANSHILSHNLILLMLLPTVPLRALRAANCCHICSEILFLLFLQDLSFAILLQGIYRGPSQGNTVKLEQSQSWPQNSA